jgi:UDPglucose 6-dehydrogenase
MDTAEAKIAKLRSGQAPIYEPFLEEMMAASLEGLNFTTKFEAAIPGAEVVFIAVGTPPQADGRPDLQYLRSAAVCVGQHLDAEFTVIVNKSTVPIGSGNWVESLVRETRRDGRFAIASNPEFLREGTAIGDTLYPDRIVIGADQPHALETLYRLYRPILDQSFTPPSYLPRPEEMGAVPLVSTDLASAELIKYAANAFLALKISYINEVGLLAERVGADIQQVAKGIGLDSRIGTRFLQAGIGWGGSCFGKDTSALISTAKEYKLSMPIVDAARTVNYHQRERVVEKLLGELKILKGRSVGLLGLAFKPNTDDLREAPSLDIARQLLEHGARVKVHDPVALEKAKELHPDLPIQYCAGAEEVAKDSDAVVVVTEWPEYRDIDWESLGRTMRMPILLDGRSMCDRQRLVRAGFRYLTLAS